LLQGDFLVAFVRKGFLAVSGAGGTSAFDYGVTVGRFDDFEFESALVAVEHDAVAFPWLIVSASLATTIIGGGDDHIDGIVLGAMGWSK
jgi:hypothetical protein